MIRKLGLLTVLTALVAAIAATAGAAPDRARTVSIFAPRGTPTNCARVFPLTRTVAPPALLKRAMRALLAGPTRAERARGYDGWFSAKTAGHLRSVRLTRGVAYIDFANFARVIPNASSSCGSAMLLGQLDRTAKQFPTVKHTVYSFNGSPKAFYRWLQLEPPLGSVSERVAHQAVSSVLVVRTAPVLAPHASNR